MSKVLVEIDLDNDAFADRNELVRILNKLADDVGKGFMTEINIRDINGNKVGTFKIVNTTD